jgi:uncharacterized cupin superfamily protein
MFCADTTRRNAMTTSRRHPRVVNLEEVTPDEQGQGGFGFRRRRLGPEAGARALGCSHFELLPGKTAFPLHFHSAIEEAIFVLEGSGRLRIGKATAELRAGDFVALPPGPDDAHALSNTGTTPLRYLTLSAPAAPVTLDIVGYPDSKKVAFASGVDPAKGLRSAWLMKIVREDAPSLGYYDGEPLAQDQK